VRQFVVSEAPAARVARHVRDTVEDAGGIVAHHTATKTEFDHLDHGDQAWRRAGYVGTYQRFKEKPVQVRIRVWAQWPRRLLAGSIYVGFVVALLFFAASLVEAAIPPNVWIFSALPILAVIATAFLMYTSSMADSESAERRIESELVERLNEDEAIAGEVYDLDDWEAYRDTVIDEAREEARQRAPHGGSRVRRAIADVGLPTLGSDEEPAAATQDDADDSGFAAKLGFGGDADEEDEAEEPAAEPAHESDDEGALAGLKAKLGFGEDDEDEEAEDDAETEDEGSFLTDVETKLGLADGDDDAEAPVESELDEETEPREGTTDEDVDAAAG
jgi:hypothetical protein